MGEPIGEQTLRLIIEVGDKLLDHARDFGDFNPGAGIYRINDWAEYVSEEDWGRIWEDHPSWWEHAWMLTDNGQYTSDDVRHMTVDEIEAAYHDPDFCPAYAYYTESPSG